MSKANQAKKHRLDPDWDLPAMKTDRHALKSKLGRISAAFLRLLDTARTAKQELANVTERIERSKVTIVGSEIYALVPVLEPWDGMADVIKLREDQGSTSTVKATVEAQRLAQSNVADATRGIIAFLTNMVNNAYVILKECKPLSTNATINLAGWMHDYEDKVPKPASNVNEVKPLDSQPIMDAVSWLSYMVNFAFGLMFVGDRTAPGAIVSQKRWRRLYRDNWPAMFQSLRDGDPSKAVVSDLDPERYNEKLNEHSLNQARTIDRQRALLRKLAKMVRDAHTIMHACDEHAAWVVNNMDKAWRSDWEAIKGELSLWNLHYVTEKEVLKPETEPEQLAKQVADLSDELKKRHELISRLARLASDANQLLFPSDGVTPWTELNTRLDDWKKMWNEVGLELLEITIEVHDGLPQVKARLETLRSNADKIRETQNKLEKQQSETISRLIDENVGLRETNRWQSEVIRRHEVETKKRQAVHVNMSDMIERAAALLRQVEPVGMSEDWVHAVTANQRQHGRRDKAVRGDQPGNRATGREEKTKSR